MLNKQAVASVEPLRKHINGSVLVQGDADYDSIRQGWNLAKSHAPAVIVVAENVQDVIAAVNYAREAGLGVSVQSTGHGMQQPADDNVLIVTSRMQSVQVDAKAHTARVEAGVLWGRWSRKLRRLG